MLFPALPDRRDILGRDFEQNALNPGTLKAHERLGDQGSSQPQSPMFWRDPHVLNRTHSG